MSAAQPAPAAPRLGRTLWSATVTVLVGAAVVAGVHFAAQWRGATFEDFSRDPVQTLDGEFYTGWFHYLVVLVWCVGAAVALFGAWVLHRAGWPHGARFLLAGGVLTAAMGLDDAFLLHDHVYRALGVPEGAVFATYAIATAALAFWYRRRLGADLLLVLGAYGFWTASVALDVLLGVDAPYVIEDGAKGIGVTLWTLLMVKQTLAELRPAVDTGSFHSVKASARHRRDDSPMDDAPPDTGSASAVEQTAPTEVVPRVVVPAVPPRAESGAHWPGPGPAGHPRPAPPGAGPRMPARPAGRGPTGSHRPGPHGWAPSASSPDRPGALPPGGRHHGPGRHDGSRGRPGPTGGHGAGDHAPSGHHGVPVGHALAGRNGTPARNGSTNGSANGHRWPGHPDR